jgi:hypothetical protein
MYFEDLTSELTIQNPHQSPDSILQDVPWWEDNIKMYLREIGIVGVNWIQLAQDRVQWRAFVNTVMNLRVP